MTPLAIKPGDRFGRLTVLHRVRGDKRAMSVCRCECGAFRNVLNFRLRNGTVSACMNCAVLERKFAVEIAAEKRKAAEVGCHAIDPEELPKRAKFEFEGDEAALAAAQEGDSQ